ncbi:hypothetical protein [Aureivirga marina]|uniref:hypothetical protein n=1 Tax=Aureivirga marina TaxID=1182451 RepID=UPI0018CAB322|nr:hypothetical protein [Aureivirga marina]
MKKEFEKRTKKWKKKIILDISKLLLLYLVAAFLLFNYIEKTERSILFFYSILSIIIYIRKVVYKNLYILKIKNDEEKFTFIYYSFLKGIQKLIVQKDDLLDVFCYTNKFIIKHQVKIVSWETKFLIDTSSSTDLIYSNLENFKRDASQILDENIEIIRNKESFKYKIKNGKKISILVSIIILSYAFVYYFFF